MKKKFQKGIQKISGSLNLFKKVSILLEEARARAIQSVNVAMVSAYWLVGKEIVSAEESHKNGVRYGNAHIESLSQKLTKKYGNGWSSSHIWHIRQFYLEFRDRVPVIGINSNNKSSNNKNLHTLCAELSWSHYRILMRIESLEARNFYEVECARNRWTARELERQKGTLLYERLAMSKNKKGLKKLAYKGQEIQSYKDMIKDPYILEFTGLSPNTKLYETNLEQGLFDNLSRFLLELGKGFTFVGRQKRISLDGDHFYIDLVFYNTLLKCYVLIDLKIGKLTHQDIGQMQMYVNYYDREIKEQNDNPTVGLVLCEDKKEAVVRYTLSKENEQIFASKYKLYLPSEKELRKELTHQRNRNRFHLNSSDRFSS